MELLPKRLKDTATAAFRDNAEIARLSNEEREQAAQWYEQVADQTVGTMAGLARLYNLERARFLRGETAHIAATAREFAEEIGWSSDVSF